MRVWLLAVAVTLLSSCSLKPPRVTGTAPRLQDREAEKAYQAVLDRYTARKEIYDLFDTRLFSAATYQSETFRRAKALRMAAFRRLDQKAYEAELARELAEANERHTFFFGAHVNEISYDDFDRRDSVWRITLTTPAGEFSPVEVVRVGRGDEAMRAYYPYMDAFWTAYEIHFPKQTSEGAPTIPEGTDQIVLRLSSSLGNADFPVSGQR